ncbi:MAG: magnesium chelatase domain-containing protein, partial [Spirillospora sp.]
MVDSAAHLARLRTVSVIGIDTFTIDVHANITPGLSGLHLTGLPDAALPATGRRVLAAITSSGLGWPPRHIAVSLTPPEVVKPGAWFDLPIAVAVLAANGTLPLAACARMLLIGQLGEDGSLQSVPGAVAAARHAAANGIDTVVVPPGNVAEARFVPGVTVLTADSLRELVTLLGGESPGGGPDAPPPAPTGP